MKLNGVGYERFSTLRSGRLVAQIFNQTQMLNRITNLESTTEPAITQNGYYVPSITVRWGLNTLTFRPDVKQLKSNNLASWRAAPLVVIHCWQHVTD